MKTIRAFLIIAVLCTLTTSCHDPEQWDNDNYGNFDALWKVMDEHYCFFKDKGVNWDSIGTVYRSEIDPAWKQPQLFEHCARMLNELHDGHTNLISWFNTSYYRQWWSDYPQNFNLRLIQQYYLGFNYNSGSGFMYKYLADRKVGYIRYSSFSNAVSHSFVDAMLLACKDGKGIIIDVRDNGGGNLTNVEAIVSHFIRDPYTAGSIQHKTGPGHEDFSERYEYTYQPADNHVRWFKPVVVLTNRSTFSAANNFTAAMKYLPQVIIVGDRTGGGAGSPFSSEIPNGWGVRFSACPMYDAKGILTENGVDPHIKVDMNLQDEQRGVDTMIETAIELLNKGLK